jgi:hypothetical protein
MLKADKKRVAGHAVERGKRLIEEKQTRRWCQRARQCHALCLAAGQILWAAGGEVGGADKIQHFVYAAGACGAIEALKTVGHIRGGAEVREECGLLRDQRSLAMAGWNAKSCGGFSEGAAIESDTAADWMIETCEQTKQCAFACA